MLRVISDSPGDLQPVFDTILEHTIQLCAGNTAVLWQFDGQLLRFAAGFLAGLLLAVGAAFLDGGFLAPVRAARAGEAAASAF